MKKHHENYFRISSYFPLQYSGKFCIIDTRAHGSTSEQISYEAAKLQF